MKNGGVVEVLCFVGVSDGFESALLPRKGAEKLDQARFLGRRANRRPFPPSKPPRP
jgi:hypothetical protein